MPDAPRVTITDPSRPGGAQDLMTSGDEREPWRATSRQKRLGVGAVVLVLLAAGGRRAVQDHRQQSRLDAASVRRVAVVVTTQPELSDPGTGAVRLALRNDGTEPVRVERLRIDLPGLPVVTVDDDLDPAELTGAEVPTEVTCSPDVARPAREVKGALTVRTARGVRAIVPITLDPVAATALLEPAQDRCHHVPPLRALAVTLHGDAHRVGREVVADLRLVNTGLEPLTLTRVGIASSFTLRSDGRVPLVLPPVRLDDQGHVLPDDGVPLSIRIGIADCAIARQVLTDVEIPPGADVEVTNAFGSANLDVDVLYDASPLTALVTAVCP